MLEDAGCSYGTWLDGRRVRAPTPLRVGSRIRLGDQELLVGRPPRDDEAAPTIARRARLSVRRLQSPAARRAAGLGAFVFVLGRLAVAAVHESAHGLVMASFGRAVREAGLKLVLIFPYLYVDTSDAWFEPRRRRIAVSAAGPASDLCLGGTFALCCLAAAPGTIRDVCFQFAFGAYVGAFVNLNPLVVRDGYHVLADVLREPGLRRRATAQLRRRLAGASSASDSSVLTRYSQFGLAWSVLGASVAVAMSLRYEAVFARLAPAPLVWVVMCAPWVALFVPVLALVGMPLLRRLRTQAG